MKNITKLLFGGSIIINLCFIVYHGVSLKAFLKLVYFFEPIWVSLFAITFGSYLINMYNKMMLNMYKNITGQDKTEFVYVPVYKFKTF